MHLSAAKIERKTGLENFHSYGDRLEINLLNFWQWSSSDLLSNALRGVLAEFVVACDFDVADGIRNEWDAVDLVSKSGAKIEVKSAAYVQSWEQKGVSKISFGIQPTYGWDYGTNTWGDVKKRQADFYVFCLLAHKDKKSVDPLEISQWRFLIINTELLNRELGDQKSITLSKLLSLKPHEAKFGEISTVVESMTGEL